MDLNRLNTFTNKIIYLFLLLISVDSIAGVADLEVTLNHQPLDNLQFGDIGQFSITITNYGPDIAGADSPLNMPVVAILLVEAESSGAPLNFTQDNTIAQDCSFFVAFGEPISPNPLTFAYIFRFPQLPVGDSITCFGTYEVFFDTGTRTVEWNVSSGLDTDPDESNNTQAMVFGIQPIQVPLLSNLTLFVLALLMFVFSSYFLKKKTH